MKKVGVELLNYQSVKNWFESLDASAQSRGRSGLTQQAKRVRLGRMWEYTEEGKLNPDELLKEAQADIDKAGQRLKDYFDAKLKTGTSHNTLVTNIGLLRGFYTHNNLVFPKKWGVPRRVVSKVSQRDEKTALYDYDGEKGEVVFKNGTLQHFVQNLNFRDQTIALCLLSTGADATDLLNLNMDFVKDAKGRVANVKRFFWHSNRAKTSEEFKTFFSEEATEFLKRYVEQERVDASDDEPLFVKEDNGRLDAHALAMNFRASAEKMGYVKDGVTNSFRPKRFRHWFRTACGIAHVEEGYTKAMMGHSNDVSAGYLERNKGLFEMEYVKVEPYVTVFGVNKNVVNEMSQEVEGLKENVVELVTETKMLKAEVQSLKRQLEIAVLYINSLELEAKEQTEKQEAQRDFNNLVDELNKTHPVPTKKK
jgi:integrase/regulator of replication initiation timing